MLLIVLAYLGGVLTIVSPCILPVLPFVFSSAGRPFRRSTLPLLAGMALTFTAVATLAAVGGGWAITANEYGRWLAMALVGLFGLALLLPRVADRLAHPLVQAGGRLSHSASDGSPRASFLLGAATGLLWAPCAGPILGLVLTGAAVHGASFGSAALLLAYAAGAATSLALALLLGGKVLATMKRALGVGEWIRRGLGAAMLAGVAAIALGLDTTVLAQVSTASTDGVERFLVKHLKPRPAAAPGMAKASAEGEGSAAPATQAVAKPAVGPRSEADMARGGMPAVRVADAQPADPGLKLPDRGAAPALDGAVQWLNTGPQSLQALRGKVVLVDFWTYSCINCLHTLPYVKQWEAKYRDQGLVVIGVHSPEFAFERKVSNVQQALKRLGIVYPVAIDNDFAIWNAYGNEYWPAHYFIDARGRVRYLHIGEGDYAHSEQVIRQLLHEAAEDRRQAAAQDAAPVRS